LKTTINDVVRYLVDSQKTEEDNYFEIVHAIALIFPKNLIEQLQQLVKGPIYDGDIISKSNRSELFDMGLAIRVCCKGEQGFTGSPYIGYSIVKKLVELQKA